MVCWVVVRKFEVVRPHRTTSKIVNLALIAFFMHKEIKFTVQYTYRTTKSIFADSCMKRDFRECVSIKYDNKIIYSRKLLFASLLVFVGELAFQCGLFTCDCRQAQHIP